MNKRMNLFRELQSGGPRKQAKLTLSANVIMIGFVGFISMAGTLYSSLRYNSEVRDIDSRIASNEFQLTQMMEASSTQLKTTTLDGRRGLATGFDNSWTAVLWKISTFTPPSVALKKLELTQSTPPNSPPGFFIKQVNIEGVAKSLPSVKEWLDLMQKNVPGYDFMMNSQSQTIAKDFPVSFKVTARTL